MTTIIVSLGHDADPEKIMGAIGQIRGVIGVRQMKSQQDSTATVEQRVFSDLAEWGKEFKKRLDALTKLYGLPMRAHNAFWRAAEIITSRYEQLPPVDGRYSYREVPVEPHIDNVFCRADGTPMGFDEWIASVRMRHHAWYAPRNIGKKTLQQLLDAYDKSVAARLQLE